MKSSSSGEELGLSKMLKSLPGTSGLGLAPAESLHELRSSDTVEVFIRLTEGIRIVLYLTLG